MGVKMSSSINFNEDDVKKFYQFLGHEKETEVRILFKGRKPQIHHVNSEDDFIKKCKEYNGLGNVYAGLNERKTNGTKAEDVISVSRFPVDIDSPRDSPKENPATDEELKIAEQIKDKILLDMLNNGFKKPLVVHTGNGFQIHFKIPKIILTEQNRSEVDKKSQMFQQNIIKEYSKQDCIDNIGDLPRIVRVPGTMNIKGTEKENRPHRLSKIISIDDAGEDSKLLDYFLSLETPEDNFEIKPTEEISLNHLPKCINYLYKEHKFKDSNGWMRTVSILSSFFRSIGLSENKTLELINKWNLEQFYHESGETEQIKEIVGNVYRKQLFCPNCEKIRKNSSGFPYSGLKEIFGNVKLGSCCGKYKNPVVYYNAKVKRGEVADSPQIMENFSLENVLSDKISEDVKIVKQSGKLDDGVFYWVVPVYYRGRFIFVVMTENGKIVPVINNYEQIRNSLTKEERRNISDEEKYFYFEYDKKKYKLNKELYFTDIFNIRVPSKDVLNLSNYKINKSELFNRLVESLKEYFDHSNDIEYNMVIAFAIISYIQWGYGKSFYLIIKGKEDTGKSTVQQWLSKTQMNGYFAGKSSIAVAVRFLHYFGISLNQDEFEKINKDEKPVVLGVFNTGLNIEGTYNLVNMNKKLLKDQITSLYTFGAKSFSSNSDDLSKDFDKAFISRCYPLTATRKNRKTKNINSLTTEDNSKLQKLCDETFVYCLLNYSSIEKDIKDVEAELENGGLFGRKTDLYSLILGIIKHFKGDCSREKQELISREGVSDSNDFTHTKETAIFECITNKFIAEKESNLRYIEIQNREIKEYVDTSMNLSEQYKISSRAVAAVLKNYSLVTRDEQIKRVGGQGNIKYVISLSEFLDVLRRFRFNSLIESIEHNFTSSLTSRSSLASQSSQIPGQTVLNSAENSEERERSEAGESNRGGNNTQISQDEPVWESDNS